MEIDTFFARQGFETDPFESTNAENEPRLAEYFVSPPYFATVLGDPSSPQSHVVLAPRGSGKTAQRKMIEARSTEDTQTLCLLYATFDMHGGLRVADATWSYHMTQICPPFDRYPCCS